MCGSFHDWYNTMNDRTAATAEPALTTDPLDRLRALYEAEGVAGRRIRTVVQLLIDEPHDLASLVQTAAVDRRTVEAVLAAVGQDLSPVGERMRIAEDRVAAYRDVIDTVQLTATRLSDPLERRIADSPALVAKLERIIGEGPSARQSLDHVSATAETAARRALWMDSTFELAGGRLLCVGDHDLTSLATALARPDTEITVVDVDERILEYIDTVALREGLSVRCLYADFRFGIAEGARAWGDLVFTDPPYTADGVRLFLSRGLEGLRDRDHARLLMAYGFSENHPGLGLKIQQAVGGLNLVYEAVLPDFNRYHGAQAVGSSSDLYVLRPTVRSWRVTDQAARESAANIYTHGAQSLEAERPELSSSVVRAVVDAACSTDQPLTAVVGDGWPRERGVPRIGLGTVLAGGLPNQMRRPGSAVAVDLSADLGAWLLRALLAVDADRAAFLVPNAHPDLSNEAGQTLLRELVGVKYTLRLRRSTPEPRYAIVEAERVKAAKLSPQEAIVRHILDRPHGKVANTWREALIAAASRAGSELTKNEARALVRSSVSADLLNEQLIDLPRHQIRQVLDAAVGSLPG